MPTQEYLFGPEAASLPSADIVMEQIPKSHIWHHVHPDIQRVPGYAGVVVRFYPEAEDFKTAEELHDMIQVGQRHMGMLATGAADHFVVPSQRAFVTERRGTDQSVIATIVPAYRWRRTLPSNSDKGRPVIAGLRAYLDRLQETREDQILFDVFDPWQFSLLWGHPKPVLHDVDYNVPLNLGLLSLERRRDLDRWERRLDSWENEGWGR